MSLYGGSAQKYVAIPRFLLLIIYSKKIGTGAPRRYSEIVVIRRCRYREVALYMGVKNRL